MAEPADKTSDDATRSAPAAPPIAETADAVVMPRAAGAATSNAEAESARGARASVREAESAGERADLLGGFADSTTAHTQDGAHERSAAETTGERPQDKTSAHEATSTAASSIETASADAAPGRRDASTVDISAPVAPNVGADDAAAARPPRSRRSSSRRANGKKQAAESGTRARRTPEGDAARGQASGGRTVTGEAARSQASAESVRQESVRQESAEHGRAAEAAAKKRAADRAPTNPKRADSIPANSQPASPVAIRTASAAARSDAAASDDAQAPSQLSNARHANGNATPAAYAFGAMSGAGGVGNSVSNDNPGNPGNPPHPPATVAHSGSPASGGASASPAPDRQTAEPHAAPAPSNAHAAPLDLDAQLRPLADRVRALQSETIDLRRAADTEMRRVNRLLLALAVVVLAAIAALIVQAIQSSRQRDEYAALQQRIDRLVAAQATQEATIATLTQRQDELGAQLERLTTHPYGVATPARRPHRGRGH
ncbi:hypothetical protein WS72_29920 [Burkholderia savannae]|uniref:Flagellar hook-length control protein FliK n=2 Tax=Burkholderia savannae TaxID=1637837 RepID=A0ABR5T6Z2_9BURK|nr:hypothetical protein WS72_29920 [Burkholderia savannae]